MRQAVVNILTLAIGSLAVTIVTYAINLQLFSSNSALFIEGIVSILAGILFLLGSGGINLWSQKAAILAAATEAISGKEQPKPSEIYKLDRWKPRGFTRLGLILIIAGILMLVLYFITL